MWNVWRWPVASNERAVANARAAAVECSRRRLEAAEVQDYLRLRATPVIASAERSGSSRTEMRWAGR